MRNTRSGVSLRITTNRSREQVSRYKLISVIYLAFIMSNPYLLSPNYPNQPSLSSRALCRTTKSMIPPSAGQFGLIYKGSIHSSQKLIIFYPKFFKKTRFLLQATLPAAIRGRGRIRVEFVAHCRNSALFESNPSILFSFGTRSGVTSSVTIKATAPTGGVEPQSNSARTAVNRVKKSFFLAEDPVPHGVSAFYSVSVCEGIRSSQKLIFFYSKLRMKMVEGGFDPDSFRVCASGEASTRRPRPRRRYDRRCRCSSCSSTYVMTEGRRCRCFSRSMQRCSSHSPKQAGSHIPCRLPPAVDGSESHRRLSGKASLR